MITTRRVAAGSFVLLAVGGAASACGEPSARSTTPAPAPSQGEASPVNAPPSGSWIAPYVGTWSGHGRQIVIRTDGSGVMNGRTYLACDTADARENPGVPCEPGGVPADVSRQTVRIKRSDDAERIVLQVVTTNDVDAAVGIYRTTLTHANKVLTVRMDSPKHGPADVSYCSPELDSATGRDTCG